MQDNKTAISRRQLLHWIGVTAGATAMYQSMSALSFASESNYDRNFTLSGAPKGSSILILGAGLAGMTAAYELRKAGYKVKVLEYNAKAGGAAGLFGEAIVSQSLAVPPNTANSTTATISTRAPGAFPITTMRCSITAISSVSR